MMKLILSLALLLAAFVQPSKAQVTFDYGKPEELKGVQRIYIDTGTDLKAREEIVKYISTRLPELIIVSDPEEAQVRLAFITDTKTYASKSYQSSVKYSAYGSCFEHTIIQTVNTPTYTTEVFGSGIVVKCAGDNRLRILMSFRDSRSMFFERQPSVNFARAFVKEYLKANSEKATPKLDRDRNLHR